MAKKSPQTEFTFTLKNQPGKGFTEKQFKSAGSFMSSVLSNRKQMPHSIRMVMTDGKKTGAPSQFRGKWKKVTEADYVFAVPGEIAHLHYDASTPDEMTLSVKFHDAVEGLKAATHYPDVQTAVKALEQAHLLKPKY